jgi:hypothetical protein
MKDVDDLDMYADDFDTDRSVRSVSINKRSNKVIEVKIFDQKMSMVNTEYVDLMQQTINQLLSKVRDMDLRIKRLNIELRDLKGKRD